MVKMSKTDNRNKEAVNALAAKRNTKAASLLLIPLLVMTAVLPLANIAYASPPTTVSGGWTIIYTPICTAIDDGILKCVFTGGERTHTGDIDGIITVEGFYIMNLHKGLATIHAEGVMDGTVLGRSGQAVFYFDSKTDLNVTPAQIVGVWTMSNGTGGLKGVHGQGSWVGVAGVGGTYSGQIHFDP